MHRLFLDQNVRVEVSWGLRDDGHEVIHASEAGLGQRDDPTVFQWAQAHRLTLVTFDIDFAERSYWGREPHHGIVRLRLEPQTPSHVLRVLRAFLASRRPESLKNTLAIVTEKKVRLRRV